MKLGEVTSRVPGKLVGRVADAAFEARVLSEAGILKAVRPGKLARMGWTLARWGTTPATAAATAAIH